MYVNSLTTKQTTKCLFANFQKTLSPSYIKLRIQRLEGNSVDLDEVAHCEPPHQDLCCLPTLVLKELRQSLNTSLLNPFKPNGFFHSYYLEKSILHFRGVRLIFSSLA